MEFTMKKLRSRSFRPSIERLEDRAVPATFTVTTFADTVDSTDGLLSLREAINAANALPGPDTIRLPAGTFRIERLGDDNTNDRGDFDLSDSLTIIGAAGASIIEGNRVGLVRDRLFDVLGPINMTFLDLTLRNGGNNNLFGGAVQALTANIEMHDCLVTGNTGLKGGAINAESGKVTLLRTTMNFNSSQGDGGAVFAGSGPVLLVDSEMVINSTDSKGGGVFDPNGAVGKGGGIFDQSGAVTLIRSRLSDNHAAAGGGIAALGGAVTIRDSSAVDFNGSSFDGGGILCTGGTTTVTNSSVSNNVSVTSGGGIAATAATLNNGTVSNNNTQGFGGGISAVSVTLTNGSVVNDNTAGGAGGGIFSQLTTTLTGLSTVSGNTAEKGGGIFATTASLTNSTVSFNHASTFAGGIAAPATILLTSTVSNNSALGAGGGIDASTLIMTTSTVSDNDAGDIGGGIHAGTATLDRSTVNDNHTLSDGGGIFADTANLTNSTISGNRAGGDGGGVHLVHGSFLNDTIVLNEAGNAGGGVFTGFAGGSATVKNTIIAKNTAHVFLSFTADVAGDFVSLGHNLIGNGSGGVGFSNGVNGDQVGTSTSPIDPRLGTFDFHGGLTKTYDLLPGSPAIDRGDNAGAPATDQRGVARPRDGDGDGSKIVDIGAFEL
jgi:CSLREA domain-containing protein